MAKTLESEKPPIPFHVGLLAALTKEKVKTEWLCLLFGLVAMASLITAFVTGSKEPPIVGLDASNRTVPLQKLAAGEYWDSHLQSFAVDFLALYFDKDPLAAKTMTERALSMMTENLREREQPKALDELYRVMGSNLRIVTTVRTLELDPQDRFVVHILGERVTRSLTGGHEGEKKEIVRIRLHLAPEPRSLHNQFKGLRVRDYTLEVI